MSLTLLDWYLQVIPDIFMCAGYENGKMDSCQVDCCLIDHL